MGQNKNKNAYSQPTWRDAYENNTQKMIHQRMTGVGIARSSVRMPAMSHFFQLKHTIVIISVASWQRSSMARHILPAPQTTDTVALSVLYDSNETLQQVLILGVAL